MTNKYKIGDKVKFVSIDNDNYITNYYYNNTEIPEEYIIHGSLTAKTNEGEIVYTHFEYFIVRYIDEYTNQVQLGFKEEDIELLNKEEVSLVGRYIKALVDNAQNSKIVKNQYYLIKKENSDSIYLNTSYCLGIQYQNKDYELMPIGFTPKQELKWQFELDKWYKTEKFTCYIKIKSYNEEEVRGEVIYPMRTYHENNYFCNEEYINDLRLLIDLSEIQGFLPDGHVDKINTKKHVKDLKYPDVVEINSQEEYNAIGNINGYDMPYNKSDKAYLISKDGKIGYGKASNMETYSKEFDYNHYKFSDLIFPEISAKHCEVTGNNTTIDIPEYVKCINSWHKAWTSNKIYKVEEEQNDFPNTLTLKDNDGFITNVSNWIIEGNNTGGFIPSTKEAYDKYYNTPIVNTMSINGKVFYEKEVEYIQQVGDWVTIKDSSKLRDGCKGCPEGTFMVVEDEKKRNDNIQGLLPSDEKTFVVKINDTKYWRISNEGVIKALPNEIPLVKASNTITIDLSNTKIWIGNNPELSKLVQYKAFELGFNWLDDDDKIIQHTDKEALYFYDDRDITYSSSGKEYFNKKHKEIYPSDLGIRIPFNLSEWEREAFFKELPNNNNNQINKLQRVKPKLIEIKKLN